MFGPLQTTMNYSNGKTSTDMLSNTPKSLVNRQGKVMSRNHSTRGFEPNQSETVMQRQRRNYKQNREKAEETLDGEKKHRIELEKRLLKAKQQISLKDKELAQSHYKMNSLVHENRNLKMDNQSLCSDIESAREAYTYKIEQLEHKVNEDDLDHRNVVQKYSQEFASFRQEGREYIDTLTFQYQRKAKCLENKVRQLGQKNNDLTEDIKRLNDRLVDQQVTYEEEIRGTINRIREDQIKKYQTSLRGIEQKLKTSDGIRESLLNKNHQLMKQFQEKQHTLSYLEINKTEESTRLQEEVSHLKDRMGQLKFCLDRANSELLQKDQQIVKLNTHYQPANGFGKQQLQAKKRQIDNLSQTIRELRQQIKEANKQHEYRHSELVQKCNYFESEWRRYKAQNAKIWQNVKSKLNETISHVDITSDKLY